MPDGVVFQRGWPLLPPRIAILDRVRCGEITREQAEMAAAKLGVGPLAREPNPADFDPMQEASWSLLMAMQWLKTHSADAVRDVWDKYLFEFWEWRQITSEPPYPEHVVGYDLRQRGPAILAHVFYPLDGSLRMTAAQAEEWLLRGKGLKAVRVFGSPSDGTEPLEIPAHHRVRLQLRDTKDGDGVALRFGNNPTRGYEGPYLLSEELVNASRTLTPPDSCIPGDATQTKIATTTLPTAAAETACCEWLQGIMEASPEVRARSSADLLKEAQTKFPRLSKRGYERARIAAAKAACAPAWLKGGAPKKPPQ